MLQHAFSLQHVEEQASVPHLQLQSDIKMKLYEETTDKLTRAVLAIVAQEFQQERALLLTCTVSVFLDNCKDNEGNVVGKQIVMIHVKNVHRFFIICLMRALQF